jgi:putative ABC transport system substrate-binding protein
VVQQLQNELGDEFNVVVTTLVEKRSSVDDIEKAVVGCRAKVVVLLNNSTARLYRKWSDKVALPPVSVILMASFVDQLQREIRNSVGIAYEAPAVTSFAGLRALGVAVGRVGVVYRKSFRAYVEAQRKLSAVEEFPFVTQELGNEPTVRELKAALVRLKRAGVDAVWLPNDNALLSREMVAEAWIPYLERLELPLVVGVPSLIRDDTSFGTFATIPDPEAMAIQAADLIFEIKDNSWSIAGYGVSLPLSVKSYVAPRLALRYGMDPEKLQNVDVVAGEAGADALREPARR